MDVPNAPLNSFGPPQSGDGAYREADDGTSPPKAIAKTCEPIVPSDRGRYGSRHLPAGWDGSRLYESCLCAWTTDDASAELPAPNGHMDLLRTNLTKVI